MHESTAPPIGRLRRLARGLAYAVCFVLGWATAAALIHSFLPAPGIPDVEMKLAHLRAHGDEYDTLFFGSSRIYHQIDPQLFDSLTARAGRATKSFNAGINVMTPPELNKFVEDVLRRPHARLRWVILESYFLNTDLHVVENNTGREVYWHDWPRLRLLWRAACELRKPPKRFTIERWLRSWEKPWLNFRVHLRPFVQNYGNLGYGEEFAQRLLLGPPLPLGEQIDRDDGFFSTRREGYVTPALTEGYIKAVAEMREKGQLADLGSVTGQENFDAMLRALERAGARVMVVTTPTTAPRKFQLALERARGRLVADYSDLDKYPELFALENRLDVGHLSPEGAAIFTKLVASDFLKWQP